MFFVSTPGQGPKAAKYAVLAPGPGMFVNVRNAPRVVIPPPIQNAPCFAVCALVCDFSRRAECVPTFARESERGRLREKLKSGWEIKFMVATLQDFLPLLMVMGHREPGNVCI